MFKPKWIETIFYLAGGINVIGILIFSRVFTNTYMTDIDPITFSPSGIVTIILWGLAYLSVARSYDQVRMLVGVFAVEKWYYGGLWLHFMKNHIQDIPTYIQNDWMTGLFYAVYGVNDLLFGGFFMYVCIQCSKPKINPST